MQTNTSFFLSFFFFFSRNNDSWTRSEICWRFVFVPPPTHTHTFFFLLEFSNLHRWGPSWSRSPPMLSRACAVLSPPVERARTGFGGAAGTSREFFSGRTPILVSSTGPFSGSPVAGPSSAAEIGVALLCSGLRPCSTLQLPGAEARTTCLTAGSQESATQLGRVSGGVDEGSLLQWGDTRPKDGNNLKHQKGEKGWRGHSQTWSAEVGTEPNLPMNTQGRFRTVSQAPRSPS